MSILRIQENALKSLMAEVFSNVRIKVREAHEEVVKENNTLRGCSSRYCLFDGEVFPRHSPSGFENARLKLPNVPSVHYSLIEKLDAADRIFDDYDETYVKNYFIAVLSMSTAGMVLNQLLPVVLVNELKSVLGSYDYDKLDYGEDRTRITEDRKSEIQNAIESTREVYATAITKLRMVLMDKLLLEG